ncbi:dTDP-4-dehydrorhamnose 3,5-epimerase [Amylibacter sp.]|nr:dTDP-4-dehydrorhamnose 3,5-epimerase [Amylibacter sp.]
MNFLSESLEGVFTLDPKIHGDDRGYFFETFRHDIMQRELGYKVNFIQENESKSSKGVLRGLHFQIPPYAQSKLVRVISGCVIDVIVDIRQGSLTFGKHLALELSCSNKKQIFIPRGFAHGFMVLSETAIFSYKVDNYYSPDHERAIVFDDNDLNINWHLKKEKLIISKKDMENPKFKNLPEYFNINENYYE